MNSSNNAFGNRRRYLAGIIFVSIATVSCSHFGKGHHGAHGTADAAGHHAAPAHHGEHAGHSALQLNEGRKWSTDAPLRMAMRKIRLSVETEPASRGSGPLEPASAMRIATEVEDQVSFMIENCKLEPKADATLHGLISEMLKGAEALKQPTPSPVALNRIQDALEQYPEYFDDPQW